MSDIVKGLLYIPPKANEIEIAYRRRVAGYLYRLLFLEYRGDAHEIHYDFESIYLPEIDDRKRFMQHHTNHGWNIELALECSEEKVFLQDSGGEFSHEYSDGQVALSGMPPDQRPDYITWSRKGKEGEHFDLNAYMIKYYRHFVLSEQGISEKSGVLFAENCTIVDDPSSQENPSNPDNIYHRIGRVTRRFHELLTKLKVVHSYEFTWKGKRMNLPPPR